MVFRYFVIVVAFAADSTITTHFVAIAHVKRI
jgi:hypothetical protein